MTHWRKDACLPKRDGHDLARVLAGKAAGDEAALENLAEDPDIPDEMVGFHAQQAVEKRIKSVLAAHEVEFERTHNIAYLLRLLADHDFALPPNSDGHGTWRPMSNAVEYTVDPSPASTRAAR